MRLPYFVPILAMYPVLFIATSNPGQVRLQAFSLLTCAALGGALSLLVLCSILFRSWQRGSLGAAVVIALFYGYGPTHTAIEFSIFEWISSTTNIGLPTTLLRHLHTSMTVICVSLVWAGLLAVRRLSGTALEGALGTLNIFAFSLVLLLGMRWWQQDSGSTDDLPARQSRITTGLQTSILGYNPDVYIIIMDGYARADVLLQQYRFNNESFLDGLRSRGFRISSGSTSNYHWTSLSLASALNMDYLEPLFGDAIKPENRSRRRVHESIRNNALMSFFAERGYRTYHLQSTWGAALENQHADVNIPCHLSVFKDDFVRTVVDASWLKALQSRMNTDLAACHLSNFSTLRTLGTEPGPKFVFAHFLLPHHPYLFDRNGTILRQATFSNQFEFQRQLWEERERYIDQLLFVNDQMIESLDGILAASRRPPIIMLMSDHGPNIYRGLAEKEIMRVRFASFGAFHLPGATDNVIPQSWSLVNLYRRLFNYYFKAGLELLPDRHYSSPYETPYELKEVRGIG